MSLNRYIFHLVAYLNQYDSFFKLQDFFISLISILFNYICMTFGVSFILTFGARNSYWFYPFLLPALRWTACLWELEIKLQRQPKNCFNVYVVMNIYLCLEAFRYITMQKWKYRQICFTVTIEVVVLVVISIFCLFVCCCFTLLFVSYSDIEAVHQPV